MRPRRVLPSTPERAKGAPSREHNPNHLNFLDANSTAVACCEKRPGPRKRAGFCYSGAQLARSGRRSPPSPKVWGNSVGLRFGSLMKAAHFYATRAPGVHKRTERGRRVGKDEILSAFQILLHSWVHKVSLPIRRKARGGRGEIGTRKREIQSKRRADPASGYNQKSYSVPVVFSFLFVKRESPPHPTPRPRLCDTRCSSKPSPPPLRTRGRRAGCRAAAAARLPARGLLS